MVWSSYLLMAGMQQPVSVAGSVIGGLKTGLNRTLNYYWIQQPLKWTRDFSNTNQFLTSLSHGFQEVITENESLEQVHDTV